MKDEETTELSFRRRRSVGGVTRWADGSQIFDIWQDAQHLEEEVGASQRGVP